MPETLETERSNCPFLTPKVSAQTAATWLAVYCRLPSGRVRVPSRGQLLSLCVAGQHHECPGYRRTQPQLQQPAATSLFR
jgi:hypothetical protein